MIGSRKPWQVRQCGRLQRKKIFFGYIDFSTSIRFISDFIYSKSGEVLIQQDKKI